MGSKVSVLKLPFNFSFTKMAFPVSTIITFAHEIGHYSSAYIHGATPSFPVVIPLGPLTIGATKVSGLNKLSKRSRRYIIASGALTGCITALFMVPVVIHIGSSLALLLIVFVGQINSLTFGSDGAKLRKTYNG